MLEKRISSHIFTDVSYLHAEVKVYRKKALHNQYQSMASFFSKSWTYVKKRKCFSMSSPGLDLQGKRTCGRYLVPWTKIVLRKMYVINNKRYIPLSKIYRQPRSKITTKQ